MMTNCNLFVHEIQLPGEPQLIEYHLLNDSLMPRPRIGIKDSEKLLAIPDDRFNQFSRAQRRDLVAQYGAGG